jgi:hypothetical protein
VGDVVTYKPIDKIYLYINKESGISQEIAVEITTVGCGSFSIYES